MRTRFYRDWRDGERTGETRRMVCEMIIAALVGTAPVSPVQLHVRNGTDLPFAFEVIGSDGGVLFSAPGATAIDTRIESSDAYELRATRPDGTTVERIEDAALLTELDVTVFEHFIGARTLEPAPGVTMTVTRTNGTAPLYSLQNAGPRTWDADRFVQFHGTHQSLLACGGEIEDLAPKRTLRLGWLDDWCALGGRAVNKARVLLSPPGPISSMRRVQRLYFVDALIGAADAGSRWVPARPVSACGCEGTSFGPLRESYEQTARSNRIQVAPGGGDHAPYVLPPGAKADPDFSEWR